MAIESVGDDSGSSAVQVAVRVRPLSAGESAQGSEACVSVLGAASVLVGGLSGKQYDFDAAFPPTVAQHEVYTELVAPLVDRFFDGYNATVFAYGQTGSGKTFTMGNEFKLSVAPAERGIIPRTMDEIFKRIASASQDKKFVLKVSYLEILNEEIHDLLTSSAGAASLSVRDDGKRGICVNGLSEHAVESLEQVATLLHAGALSRATASTNMNAQSSRSHAICTLTMEQYETTLELGAETKFSKFHLVDLAGSERAKRTNAEGARFKEGVNINKGLLSLGNVINALSEKSAHVPYRDSKLTRLLQDSLGGNSKTLMIACVSPADVNFEETCNTLRYASRARNIQNQAVINQTLTAESQVTYLKQQLEVMQLQLLQQQQNKGQSTSTSIASSQEIEILEKEIQRWKTIAKTREEELQLVMSAKDKWKKIADEFVNKKHSANQNGAVRIHKTTGDCQSPRSKAMLQDAIEFDKSLLVTQFLPTPVKSQSNADKNDIGDNDSEMSWESDPESLDDVIKEKEKIVLALTQASAPGLSTSDEQGPLTALSKSYEQKIRNLEVQVTKLAAEKVKLAIAHAQPGTSEPSTAENSSRLQSQLQQLQGQLQVARHAEKECKRLSHLWKTGTLKISTLEREIVDMKKQKATLQRQLKEESEAHRKEKREANLKIIQLKRQEQRKQYELQKLTTLHAKQNNVLKRKNEEIAAVNKRMRTLVQNQQQAQHMRAQSKSRPSTISRAVKTEASDKKATDSSDIEAMKEINKALKDSLDVQMTILGAKKAIDMELEDRKKMALEIARLENLGDFESQQLEVLKTSLKEKNADIRLLQQKLASVEKSNAIPSALLPSKLSLCHQLIRQLMDTVYEGKSASIELENCKSDLDAAEDQLAEQAQRHDEVVEKYKRELLKHGYLDSVDDAVEDSSGKDREIEELKAELAAVRAELEKAHEQTAIISVTPRELISQKPKKMPAKKKPTETMELVEIVSSSEDEDEEEDDDSDYIEEEDTEETGVKRKKTKSAATGARVRQPLKPRAIAGPKAANAMDEIDLLLSKPSVVGGNICCSCNGKCATKSCACRAEKQACGPDCSCKESKCHNRGDMATKVKSKKRRSDPLHNDKENEVEAFFDLTDKENYQPKHVPVAEPDKENSFPPATKFKKLWSGGGSVIGGSSLMSTTNNIATTTSHKSAAIARFF